MKVIYQKTKTLVTKPNNNSSDAISPNFIWGCMGGCMKSYCYVGRYNSDTVRVNTNWDDIFNSILKWRKKQPEVKTPNQQSDTQYVVDIGCSSDLSLHQKHLTKAANIENLGNLFSKPVKSGLKLILRWFDISKDLQPTFATKYPSMLKLDVNSFRRKPRVRISLMPQEYSYVLEPKTDLIEDRIQDIKRLQDLGFEVHLNFSPIIYTPTSLDSYKKLFKQIDEADFDKTTVKCEVIFLTNHKNSMERIGEEQKEIMKYSCEVKNQSGVMRYPIKYKRQMTEKFKEVLNEYLPWCEVRYCF